MTDWLEMGTRTGLPVATVWATPVIGREQIRLPLVEASLQPVHPTDAEAAALPKSIAVVSLDAPPDADDIRLVKLMRPAGRMIDVTSTGEPPCGSELHRLY